MTRTHTPLEELRDWLRNTFTAETVRFADALDQILEERGKVAIPEGWKLVPVEPTDEMLKAAGGYIAGMVGDPYNSWSRFTGEAQTCWGVVIATAPQPPKGEGDE